MCSVLGRPLGNKKMARIERMRGCQKTMMTRNQILIEVRWGDGGQLDEHLRAHRLVIDKPGLGRA